MGFEDVMEGFVIGSAEVQLSPGAVWIPPAEPTPTAPSGGVFGGLELVAP